MHADQDLGRNLPAIDGEVRILLFQKGYNVYGYADPYGSFDKLRMTEGRKLRMTEGRIYKDNFNQLLI